MSFTFWVLIPVLKIFRIGKTLTDQEAAKIIGKHFGNVQDKLLNILLLKSSTGAGNLESKELVLASIQQKINEIKWVPFSKAVNLLENKKYFPYIVPPLSILLLVLLISPSILVEGTTRLIKNDQFFEKTLPFKITILNKSLKVREGDNFEITIVTSGDALPSELSIVYKESEFQMVKKSKNQFSYLFENVRQPIPFYFKFGNLNSGLYSLDIVNNPIISKLRVKLDYPSYLELADETIDGVTDISVPEGTIIQWELQSKHADLMHIQVLEKDKQTFKGSSAQFIYKATTSTRYSIFLESTQNKIVDTFTYTIQVTPDLSPTVQLIELIDSVKNNLKVLYGDAVDDYGLSKVCLLMNSSNDSIKGFKEVIHWIPAKSEKRMYTYSHMIDFTSYDLAPGTFIEYYIEAVDVSGKVGRSELKRYSLPSVEELKVQTEIKSEEVNKALQSAMKESAELAKDIKKANEKLMNKKEISWEDKEEIRKLLDKQEQLQKNLEKIENEFKSTNDTKEKVFNNSEELIEKHRMLEQLMENLLNDEMKELVKKMQQMLEQIDKQKAVQNLNELKNNEESLSKEINRMLELFKRMELEQKLDNTIQDLKSTIEKQAELVDNKSQLSKEELKNKQDSLSQKANKLMEEMKKLEEISKETGDSPMELGNEKESLSDAENNMKKASENLDKNKSKEAKEEQKKAKENLEKSLEGLANKAAKMSNSQAEEDLESMRHLLENLINLSFKEEALMEDFRQIDINSPQYLIKSQMQQRIKSDAKMIEDSLYSLANRVVQIQSIVTKEMESVNSRIDKSIQSLEGRNVSEAKMHQQYAMTHINNLALLLSEAFEQMQQQMKSASEKQGNSSCNKPGSGKGGSKPSLPKIGEMQKQLNEQIKKMGEMMKSGSVPGDKSQSQKFAEIAKQQSALRQALEELNKTENKDGKLGNMGNVIDKMNKTETDLVNKKITQEMINRQEEITVKLLDYENAQKQKGEEEKREAKTANELLTNPPAVLLDYLKKKKSDLDKYRTVPGSLKPFYKTLIDSYFLNLSR